MKQKITPSSLPEICTIRNIQDGILYQWPTNGIEEYSTLYSNIAYLNEVVIKLPSTHGFDEYYKYVVRGMTDDDEIRGNENIERFLNINRLLARYPSLLVARTTIDDVKIHWLLIHMLQYDRLKGVIKIPETKFCFFNKTKFLFKSIYPGLVQQRVTGISLWDMIDHEVVHALDRPFVKQKYESLIPHISSQLRPLLAPEFSFHINWNIRNFTFNPQTNILYYLDLKPSNIFGRRRNEQNLRNIYRDFLRMEY
jgi:hypothetical protein